MGRQERGYEYLLLLVGSNPLPNYIASIILKPSRINLFYSRETENVKNNLRDKLKDTLSEAQLEETYIDDVTSAAKVRQVFRAIPKSESVCLNYTGGTKVMAAHARMAFRDAGGTDAQAFYLDERKGMLRFDNGYEVVLERQNLPLTLDDILALHGITTISRNNPQTSDDPTEKDAETIAKAVLNDPRLAETLYLIHRDENSRRISFEKAKKNTVNINEIVPEGLSIQKIPEDNWNKKTYENWLHFLGGGWMEIWCGAQVKRVVGDVDIVVGLNCKTDKGRQFEIDVAVVRGHRLYVISCTTDYSIGLCKSKLFEVAIRARQLGGDLARSALVCLLRDSDNKGAYVDQLRSDVAAIWDAPNPPKVFGLDDLKEWERTNTTSLKDWLNS